MPSSPAICIAIPWPINNLFVMPITLLPMHAVPNKPIIACTLHIIMLNISFSRCKRLWKGFWSIILVSSSNSLLASIKSSRACVMKFPSSGSHLHLVIVSDKSSRGEVADLIARILTRWKSWQGLWPRVSGGWQWELSWDQGGGGGEGGRCLSFDFHLSTLSRLLR